MRMVRTGIDLDELQALAQRYGGVLKAVVDVDRTMMVVDMDLHADGEAELVDDGSRQASLWGIELHPDARGTRDWIDYRSIINYRPRRNRGPEVTDPEIRERIARVVDSLVMP